MSITGIRHQVMGRNGRVGIVGGWNVNDVEQERAEHKRRGTSAVGNVGVGMFGGRGIKSVGMTGDVVAGEV
ncbi:MAG: hypothetical protein ACKPKO_30230, partial [Candidatus Fonsibacter sp.]